MATPFDAVSVALAAFLSTDTVTAGYIAGFMLVVGLWGFFLIALGDRINGLGILVPAAFGIMISILGGWWPLWTGVFIVIIVLFIVFNPYESGAAG